MPIIQIQIIEGRKQEQIQNLIFDVTEVVAKNLDVDVGRVRVKKNLGSNKSNFHSLMNGGCFCCFENF